MVTVFSEEEIQDLLLASAGLGLAFAVMFFGGGDRVGFLLSPRVVPAFLAAAALTAVSLLPRITVQRAAARVVESYAEFRLWTTSVAVTLLSSLLGVAVAMPGGIHLSQIPGERYGRYELHLTPKHIGRIAVIGPLLNVALAVIFAALATTAALPLYGTDLLTVGSRLNAVLAAATMLPVHPLDGYKVLRHSAVVWALTVALALAAFFAL